MLPILHLNGYKIANPTVLARIPHAELEALFVGYGYRPYFVEGVGTGSHASADGGDTGYGDRGNPRDPARGAHQPATPNAPRWPMIVLNTPKGWTGPKEVDGKKTEGHLALAPGAVRGYAATRSICSCSSNG